MDYITILVLIIVIVLIIILISYTQECQCHKIDMRTIYQSQRDRISPMIYFNPSIIQNEKGYLLAIRYSNANCDAFRYFTSRIYGIQSQIHLIQLDSTFRQIETTKVKVSEDIRNNYEDPRICMYNNMLYIMTTHVVEIPKGKKILLNLLQLDKEYNVLNVLKFPIISKHLVQKNWCPFSHKGKLLIHTDSYPTWTVREITFISEGNECNLNTIVQSDILSKLNPVKYQRLRCSTSWIKYKSGYVAVLHIKTGTFDAYGKYRSVFVFIDYHTLLPTMISDPLCLSHGHERIQFSSGLLIQGDNAIVTMGLDDSVYSIVKVKDFYNLLRPIRS